MFKKLHTWLILSPLIISAVIIVIILTVLQILPAKLPLFYSVAWGDKQLATHQQFLIIPSSIILITFLNLIVSWQLHPSQSFFKRVLLLSSIVISTILVIAFVKIILNFI